MFKCRWGQRAIGEVDLSLRDFPGQCLLFPWITRIQDQALVSQGIVTSNKNLGLNSKIRMPIQGGRTLRPLESGCVGLSLGSSLSAVWPWAHDFTSLSVFSPLNGALKWSEVKVARSCPTLCNLMDYTVHGILQARILEWVAFLFSRGSSQSRDWTHVSCIVGGFFTNWAIRDALKRALC